jgi:DNA-directed RNA polymerase subunit RPC12/RpoP
MTSKTAKFEDRLKGVRCPRCTKKKLIPRFPGARHRAVRCTQCGALGRLKKK